MEKQHSRKNFLKKGYQKDKVVANFVGLFPLQEPRFVIAAFLDEPENNLLQEPCRYASCTVVPMVKKLIERTALNECDP